MPTRQEMIDLQPDVPLHDKTTFRIGGPAKWYAAPRDADEVMEAVRFARGQSLPLLVLGKGSNLLVSDQGWPGLVMNTSAGLQAVEWDGRGATAQAGVPLDRLVRESIDRGQAGLEYLSGIPGTVAGAVIMNAGAYSAEIADTLVSAAYLDTRDMAVKNVPAQELDMGYRASALKGKEAIVLSASFRFREAKRDELLARRNDILGKRRDKQPLDLPNCGSVFKRPQGTYAGALIEKAGLKGMRYGNVSVSEKHANFIVNHGNGTAAQVRHLIVAIQKKAYAMSGILLEPEVIFAGAFEEPLYSPDQE
ncbi:MAG: UDP-N-acetylmuramate dehydrogenase [Chitinispirillaceae bacterium]|nr:UDP-N-acetylmuramate dehydrogenase [Chitinispirillaceae bacterium]